MKFPPIQRGTSFRIPILITKENEEPFNLTGYKLHMTLKPVPCDFDYDDTYAVLSKDGTIIDEFNGRADFLITSKESWIPPREYFFDIELINTKGAVTRLCTFCTEIIGGPTNETINDEEPEYYINGVNIVYTDSKPIIIQVPVLAQIPVNLVQDFSATPKWIWNENPTHPQMNIRSSKLHYCVDVYIPYGGVYQTKLTNELLIPETDDISDLGIRVQGKELIIEDAPKGYAYHIYEKHKNGYTRGLLADKSNLPPIYLEDKKINDIELILLKDKGDEVKYIIKILVYFDSDAINSNWNIEIEQLN